MGLTSSEYFDVAMLRDGPRDKNHMWPASYGSCLRNATGAAGVILASRFSALAGPPVSTLRGDWRDRRSMLLCNPASQRTRNPRYRQRRYSSDMQYANEMRLAVVVNAPTEKRRALRRAQSGCMVCCSIYTERFNMERDSGGVCEESLARWYTDG